MESCQHINLLEIRAAREGIQELVESDISTTHGLHLHQEEGGAHAPSPCPRRAFAFGKKW